jgi:glutaminase
MLTLENIDCVSLEKDIHKIHNRLKNDKSGKNASYIPALAKVDPSLYAISICMIDGTIINVGNVTNKFAIESCSKVFTLALALDTFGIKFVKDKIGKLSSEEAFNSICAIEKTEGHTINSFNNSGALATLSLLEGITPNKRTFENMVIKNMSKFAGKQLFVDKKIFGSEFSHSEHNLAIAYLLKSYNRFYGDIENCVDVYTKQCSAMVTSDDIAIMASTLANYGKNPITKKQVTMIESVEYILDHMLTAGLYNETSKWMKEVGLHAKSGVSGILLIVIPGVMGIGIISPPLNQYGNSSKGIKTAKLLSKALDKYKK